MLWEFPVFHNMRRTHRLVYGFTLIDLTIYGGLLGILLVILSEFFMTVITLQLKNRAVNLVEQDAEYILARATYDMRRASSISMPLIGESSATLSAMIPINDVDTLHQYALDNGKLTVTVGGQAYQLHASDTRVSSLSFTRIGNSNEISGAADTIKVAFTVATLGVGAGQRERTYETTVGTR